MRTLHVAAPLALALALAAGTGSPPARAAGPAPVIDSVTPSRGPVAGGTEVTITGTGFSAPIAVTFGGVSALTVTLVSPTEVKAVTPARPRGPVDVVVIQTAAPASPSAPAVNAFTYEVTPCRVWVPRANGSATGGNPGGFDVTIVDAANRRVDASLDLNASDADLPTDEAWRVTQVLFSADGSHAFLATAGTPGSLDSRKVFVVKTARALGTEAGAPVVAVLDTGGNPHQLALSADGKTLYAADAGSWKGSSTVLPNGTFRAWDVTNPSTPLPRGTPTTVGVLPALSYDSTAYRRWGTNSSFTGLVQSRSNRCVVTNVGSHSLSVVDLSTRNVVATVPVGIPGGGPAQLSVSLTSPYSDDFVFIQTTDLLTQATGYSIYRISTGTVIDKGLVTQPMQFFPVVPFLDIQNRLAWPHPDGENLVAVPAAGSTVATWNPATGGAPARTTVPGTAPPSSLGFNDTTGLLYARRNSGGWTVLSVPSTRGAAPAVLRQVEDATGVNALRVFGDGKEMVGTGPSILALVDGDPASATAHTILATVALPLNPLGGAAHPQPDPLCPPGRTFVVVAPPGSGPRIALPLPGTEVCSGEDPPTFEFAGGERLELELGSQPDFLRGFGAARIRLRIPSGASSFTPPSRPWRRVLRSSASSEVRPVYARVNVLIPGGRRIYGEVLALGVCAPSDPDPLLPGPGAGAAWASPPPFSFDPAEGVRSWIEFAGPGGFEGGRTGRFRARDDGGSTPPLGVWRAAVGRAARAGGGFPATVQWRVVTRDPLGRRTHSEARSLTVSR